VRHFRLVAAQVAGLTPHWVTALQIEHPTVLHVEMDVTVDGTDVTVNRSALRARRAN